MTLTHLFLTILVGFTILAGLLVYIGQKIRARFHNMDKQLAQLSTFINKKVGNRMICAINEKTQEIQNTISLSHMDFRFPLFFGGWSIDSFLGKFLVQHLLENPPRTILELGSGSSTLLIARCMDILGHNDHTHITVDHEEQYLNLTRQNLRLNGLEDKVEFWSCPLCPIENMDKLWYGGLLEKMGGRKIDLLIVDGPPGPLQELSRYPALPILYELLSPHSTVVLDDANRSDEKTIAEKWLEIYPEFQISYVADGHGIAIFSRENSKSKTVN